MGASSSRKRKRKGSTKSQDEYLKLNFELTKEQIKEYRALFNDHSENNEVITKSEFRKVYQTMYKDGEAVDFADRVFNTFDTDKSGTVDFVEFAAGLTMMDSEMISQKISVAFHMYDEDGSNTLSKQEVIDMIQAYYRLLGPNDSRSPVQVANNLFAKMDKDKDDSITFEEFTTAAKENPEILGILNPSP